jgi:mono/diheme cytochrome c family protein
MPAFALNRGGILTDEQIGSLVAYLEGDFKKEPVKAPAAAVPIPAKVPAPALTPPPAK